MKIPDHSPASTNQPHLSLSPISLPPFHPWRWRSQNFFGLCSHIVMRIPVFIYDLKWCHVIYCEHKSHEIAWNMTDCLWSRELMICYMTKQWWIENAVHSNHPTDWMTTALPPSRTLSLRQMFIKRQRMKQHQPVENRRPYPSLIKDLPTFN